MASRTPKILIQAKDPSKLPPLESLKKMADAKGNLFTEPVKDPKRPAVITHYINGVIPWKGYAMLLAGKQIRVRGIPEEIAKLVTNLGPAEEPGAKKEAAEGKPGAKKE